MSKPSNIVADAHGNRLLVDEKLFQLHQDILSETALQLMLALTLKYGEELDQQVKRRPVLEYKALDAKTQALMANHFAELKQAVQTNPNYDKNNKIKQRTSDHGAFTLVFQGHKIHHAIGADNFKKKVLAEHPNSTIQAIHDHEDAGTFDIESELQAVANAKAVRLGGARCERPGVPAKLQQRTAALTEETRDNAAIIRCDGFQAPLIEDAFFSIERADGKKVSIPRYILEFALHTANGDTYFIYPKIHTGYEARLLNQMADDAEAQLGLEKNIIQFQFLIETETAPFELPRIINELASRVNQVVLGGWDLRANALNRHPDRDGLPNLRGIEEWVAYVCDAVGIPTCGSMFVKLFIRAVTPAEEADEDTRVVMNHLIAAMNDRSMAELKTQKNSDGVLFESTWIAQTHLGLADGTLKYQRELPMELERVREKFDNMSPDDIAATLNGRIPYEMSFEEFQNYVFLLLYYAYIYYKRGDECIAYVDYGKVKFDPNDPKTLSHPTAVATLQKLKSLKTTAPASDYQQALNKECDKFVKGEMHDPATGFQRTGGLVAQAIALNKSLQKSDGSTVSCDVELLHHTINALLPELKEALQFDKHSASDQLLLELALATAQEIPTNGIIYVSEYIAEKRKAFQNYK